MSQPRSDWLFHTLRGLALLALGWAFGALYGLSSLGVHSVFLPIATTLLGIPLARANAAGWILILCACVGALAVFAGQFPLHPLILVVWATYVFGGLLGKAIVPQRKVYFRTYPLLLLIAVGAGMMWQAYPTLSEGAFRSGNASIPLPLQQDWPLISLSGVIAGLVGGMTGIGGGYVLVPLLVLMEEVPHVALWLSIWLMLPLALVSALAGARRGGVSWSQEAWLGTGAFLGGVAGATWALSFSAGMLVLCFGVALMALAFVTWRVVALIAQATSPKDG